MKYVALKVECGYHAPGGRYIYKYCIKGQRDTDLNWDMLQYGYATEEKALHNMRMINDRAFFGRLPMYNSGGYGAEGKVE